MKPPKKAECPFCHMLSGVEYPIRVSGVKDEWVRHMICMRLDCHRTWTVAGGME